MSVKSLNWAGADSYASVSANVATSAMAHNWFNCWSQPTAITKGDDVFTFELQVSRSWGSTGYANFGFTPHGLIPYIQAQPTSQHIGLGASSQTLGFGIDGQAYFGKSVVAQPLAAGSINVTQPYTVTLTVDMDRGIVGCAIAQFAISVRGQMTFAQCGVTKDNAKKLRVLVSCVSAAQGDIVTLHQRTEKSAVQLAKEAAAAARAQAEADAKRQAAARPLLEPCTCTCMRSHGVNAL